jgi:transglutaminase-like putative cysteine protease
MLNLSFSVDAQPAGSHNTLNYEINRAFSGQVLHTIQLENPTDQEIVGGKLTVPLIMNDTPNHYVMLGGISSTTEKSAIFKDEYGNTYVRWDDLTIQPGQNFTATLNYHVLSFSLHYLINLDSIVSYKGYSLLSGLYTQPEELVQSNASEIVTKAQSITEGAANFHDEVFKIYSYVTSHMHYTSEVEERGALWALANGTGDCSEYSCLFVALCRAVGIPARLDVGFAFRPSEESTVEGHMWAEYYLQNYGWVQVDPTWNLFDSIDERHLVTLKSIPEIMPYANYYFNFTNGPNSEEVKNSQEVTFVNSPTNTSGSDFEREMLTAVKTLGAARFAVAIGKALGIPLLFRTDSASVEQTLAASELNMQNALDQWQTQPLTAHEHIVEAQRQADEVLHNGWMLISYALVVFIGTLMGILAATSLLLRRQRSKAFNQDLLTY